MRTTLKAARGRLDAPWRNIACAWMRANGLDPARVPIDAEIVVDDGTITVPYYAATETGARVLAMTGDGAVMAPISVPLVAPVPDGLT